MTTLLAEAGEALYGPRWQSDLARDLGVSDRTMRRWAAGTHPTPPGLADDLRRLVEQRGITLAALAERLQAASRIAEPGRPLVATGPHRGAVRDPGEP